MTARSALRGGATTRSVAQAIVEQLEALGARLAFGVPGESYLAVLDAMRESSLRFVTCRHEGGAGYAAEAFAKLTGEPGIVMVTRGPGATNVSVAVHTAQQDESPLIVFVGDIPSAHRGRGAFQEIDFATMFAPMAKAVLRIDRADQAIELTARAWQQATCGRPGPVIVVLPEDVLEEQTTEEVVGPLEVARLSVLPSQAAEVIDRLAASSRPVVLVGGSTWDDRSINRLPLVLPGIPLVTSFRRQDLVDSDLLAAAGSLGLGADPAIVRRVGEADLLIAIGDPLGDATTNGYELLTVPTARQQLVHVYPDPYELGRVYRPTQAICSTPGEFLTAMEGAGLRPPTADRGWCEAARADYLRWQAGGGELEAIVRGVQNGTDRQLVITTGAGNFTRPVQRAARFGRRARQLAPISGSMGYGLPAALAAAIAQPDAAVWCVAGDGDLMMTVQELATFALAGVKVNLLVVNNSSYGTIRSHQERRYPGRPMATDLCNPDFVELARAFGATSTRTDDVGSTVAAVLAGFDSDRSHVVELRT